MSLAVAELVAALPVHHQTVAHLRSVTNLPAFREVLAAVISDDAESVAAGISTLTIEGAMGTVRNGSSTDLS